VGWTPQRLHEADERMNVFDDEPDVLYVLDLIEGGD